MRLTKIYTRVGDSGTTMLASGKRVAKDDLRIEAYGTVDELNSFLAVLHDQLQAINDSTKFTDICSHLRLIQNEMHDIGGELATPSIDEIHPKQKIVNSATILRLENEIDEMNASLPALANFILPGGNLANSWAHVCRTVCRRAERRVVSLSQSQSVRPDVPKYLNRLSDWLFVLCRTISQRLSIAEILWDQHRP